MGAPCDQSSLQHLARGKINHPRWTTGAAILNLYAQNQDDLSGGNLLCDKPK
jgi:hypothetical protein